MTINHIDQLREWWETAEVGDPKDGDVIIEWAGDGHAVRTFLEDERDNLYAACTYRILARAPRSHHPFPAILATYRDENGMVSGVWRPEGKPRYWEGPEGDVVHEDSLEDVTPLIEAKVTDAMVKRARAQSMKWEFGGISENAARAMLTAALGLETT